MIDLKAMFGKRYRITVDESAVLVGQTREERLWLYQIECRYGHVYVHGTNTIGAYTNRRIMRGRLMSLPGGRVHQLGDSDCTVVFAVEDISPVLDLLQARKRKNLTDEQRSEIAERLGAARQRAASAEPMQEASATP